MSFFLCMGPGFLRSLFVALQFVSHPALRGGIQITTYCPWPKGMPA